MLALYPTRPKLHKLSEFVSREGPKQNSVAADLAAGSSGPGFSAPGRRGAYRYVPICRSIKLAN
jgi:hypothetical protein